MSDGAGIAADVTGDAFVTDSPAFSETFQPAYGETAALWARLENSSSPAREIYHYEKNRLDQACRAVGVDPATLNRMELAAILRAIELDPNLAEQSGALLARGRQTHGLRDITHTTEAERAAASGPAPGPAGDGRSDAPQAEPSQELEKYHRDFHFNLGITILAIDSLMARGASQQEVMQHYERYRDATPDYPAPITRLEQPQRSEILETQPTIAEHVTDGMEAMSKGFLADFQNRVNRVNLDDFKMRQKQVKPGGWAERVTNERQELPQPDASPHIAGRRNNRGDDLPAF